MGRERVHSREFKLSVVRQVAGGRSDQPGSAASTAWRDVGAHLSMAAVSNPYENATAGRFFTTRKCEEVYL